MDNWDSPVHVVFLQSGEEESQDKGNDDDDDDDSDDDVQVTIGDIQAFPIGEYVLNHSAKI